MRIRSSIATLFAGAAVSLALAVGIESGLKPGEMVTPFHPKHVSGPDAGTDTCPPCKYGARPAVQVWVNGDSDENVSKLTASLSKAVDAHKDKELKAFVVMLTMCQGCEAKAKSVGEKTEHKNIGIAYLPNNDAAVKNYKINVSSEVKNTVMVYKNKRVAATFVNLKADKEGLEKLHAAIAGVTE